MQQKWWMWLILAGLCLVAPVGGAIFLVHWENRPVAIAGAAAIIMALYFVPFWFHLLRPMRIILAVSTSKLGGRAWYLLPMIFWVPNVLYRAVVGGSWWGCLTLAGFLALPTFVLWLAKRHSKQVNWWDFVAMIMVWLPFDTGWLIPIWRVADIHGLEAINSVMGVGYYATVFIYLRRLKGIGFEPRFSKDDLRWTGIGCAAALMVILPIGLATDFIAYNGEIWPWRMIGAGIGILMLIGIPEELLFRGFMQNAIIQKSAKPWLGLLVMSVFFGIIHGNNISARGGTGPDWRFILLASFVGFLCGIAHYKTKNLTAPVFIHTFVDALWVGYLQ